MSQPIILQSTLDVIDYVWLYIDQQREWSERSNRDYWRRPRLTDLEAVRLRLLFLNTELQRVGIRELEEPTDREQSTSWLYYEQEHEVIPIYDEALALVSRAQILAESAVPYLLAFMGIPGTKSGIDVENHDSKGYHFHYGKVKNDTLKRYDVLLTFNKIDAGEDKYPIRNIPLHIERHASAKCYHIDASTIGHNRRLPIYLVCKKAMISRGLESFMTPSHDSWQFYPAV